MSIRFKDYLAQKQESFFETEYPFTGGVNSEGNQADEEPKSEEADSEENQ